MSTSPRRSVLAGVGFAGGISGGLLGGGTGVVTVPGLEKVTSLPRPVIHGTATLANVSAAVVGSAVYGLRGGNVDMMPGLGLMIGGVIGAYLGAAWVSRVSAQLLRSLFLLVLVATSTKFLLGAFGIGPAGGTAALGQTVLNSDALTITIGALIGVVVGAWSAALGLGGGLLTVPVMAVLFGADLHTAEGTSLLVMLPNAIVGAATHLRKGTADRAIGLPLAVAALPGALVGATISLELSQEALSIVLGIFMALIALREMYRMWPRRKGESGPDDADVAEGGELEEGLGPVEDVRVAR